MASWDEVLYKQLQLINSVSRTVTNLKKLSLEKRTSAVIRSRLNVLKEKFVQCQDLDAQLNAAADSQVKTTHYYFTQQRFDTCEESYEEAIEYLNERLAEVSPSPLPVNANVVSCPNIPRVRSSIFRESTCQLLMDHSINGKVFAIDLSQ